MNQAPSPAEGIPSRHLSLPIALAVIGSLLPWALWAWFRFPAIGGADPGMWEAAAVGISHGKPSPVASAYPLLIAGLVRLLGIGWDTAGLAIAAACFGALGPVTWLLARRLGASPRLATLAGLMALGEPWLALGSLQAQPDTLSALAFSLAMLVVLAWFERPTRPRMLALVLAIGLVPQVREHAPVVAAGLLVLLAVSPGRVFERIGRLLLAVLLLLLVPTLLGETMRLPWEQNWVEVRWGEILRDFSSRQAPPFLGGTPREFERAFAAAYAEHDRLRIAWLHTTHSVFHGWTPWAWLGLGFVGWLLLGRSRWLMMIGFLPVLAVPGGAQQPRHVAVLVPLAAACWMAGLRHAGRWRLWIALVVGLGLTTLAWWLPGQAVCDHRTRGVQRAREAARGALACALAGPSAVMIGGNPRMLAYCELPIADLSTAGEIDAPLVWAGDLRRERPWEWEALAADGWAEVPSGDSHFTLYLRPARATFRP